MVTLTRAERLTLPLAPVLAIASGLLVASAILFLPSIMLERLAAFSHISAVMPAAEPPLGLTARIALGLTLGGGVMALACIVFGLLLGERSLNLSGASAFLRPSDIHPDGPPRPPLFATRDLGTPFLEVTAPLDGGVVAALDPLDMTPAEQPLPRDLNQPMAGFDPGAILLDPLPANEVVAPLVQIIDPPATPRPALIDPGDRFETFELTPIGRVEPVSPIPAQPVAATPEPVVAPQTEATVHDLLARLERGIARHPATVSASRPTPLSPSTPVTTPTGSLAGTLGDLRRLAIGGC